MTSTLNGCILRYFVHHFCQLYENPLYVRGQKYLKYLLSPCRSLTLLIREILSGSVFLPSLDFLADPVSFEKFTQLFCFLFSKRCNCKNPGNVSTELDVLRTLLLVYYYLPKPCKARTAFSTRQLISQIYLLAFYCTLF